ncbi:hypothetical protein [Marinomonas sp.]
MRRFVFLPAFLVLTGCAQSQLNVVDNLTVSARNDGVMMNPGRWFITGHPLQTTYVSLNGQLGLNIGQVCVASRFRSPFTINCIKENADLKPTKRQGQIYQEYYEVKGQNKDLQTFINAQNALQAQVLTYSSAAIELLQCQQKIYQAELSQLPENHEGDSATNHTSALETSKELSKSHCKTEQEEQDRQNTELNAKQLAVNKALTQANRLVYNWSDERTFKGGIFQSSNNNGQSTFSQQAAGYTLVNSLILSRYQLSCEELNRLKAMTNASHLKVVTMTLAAKELYYHASKDSAFSLQSQLALQPSKLQSLAKLLDEEQLLLGIEAALSSSTSLASQGYFATPEVKLSSYSSQGSDTEDSNSAGLEHGLTYYAVLSDLESLSCYK